MKYTFETWPLRALALLCNKHGSFERNVSLESNDKCMIAKEKLNAIFSKQLYTYKHFPIL